MSKMRFDLAFADCETTDLDPEKDEIIELAVVRVDARTLVEKARFHRYFQPKAPPSPEVAKINGWSAALWRERGALPLCAADLHELSIVLQDTAFAGQNVTFDRSFIRGAYAEVGLPMPTMDYHLIDVASLAWPFHVAGLIPGMSLKYTRKLFGLEGEQSHTALGDAFDTIQVYKGIMKLLVGAARSAELTGDLRRVDSVNLDVVLAVCAACGGGPVVREGVPGRTSGGRPVPETLALPTCRSCHVVFLNEADTHALTDAMGEGLTRRDILAALGVNAEEQPKEAE